MVASSVVASPFELEAGDVVFGSMVGVVDVNEVKIGVTIGSVPPPEQLNCRN